MIYYAITPAFGTVTRYVNKNDFDSVYDKVLFIVENHDTAASASSWCELASVGEIYEHEEFKIEIIDDED